MERVGRADFFAIMAPGFFIFTISAVCITACVGTTGADSVWWQMVKIWQPSAQLWILGSATIFLSFLFGSMLRAVPVNDTDALAMRIQTVWRRFWRKSVNRSEKFPFPDLLDTVFEEVQSYTLISKESLDLAERSGERLYEQRLHNIFNFWKMTLCEANERAFVFSQDLEGRVRLFAGMFWAGAVGIVMSLSAVTLLLIAAIVNTTWVRTAWLGPFSIIFGFSFIICFLFGKQLHRVRKQEVKHTFIAYLALYRRDLVGAQMREREQSPPQEGSRREGI